MKDEKIHQAASTWTKFTTSVKKAWGSLTDEELNRNKGSREKLEGYIEKTTGEKRDAVRKRVGEIAKETEHNF